MIRLPRYVMFIAVLFCWPTMVFGEPVAEPEPTYVANVGQNQLFILPEPCQLGGWFAKWRKARWLFNGQTFDACWKLEREATGGLVVKTVDDAGDTGSIPLAMFKQAQGV